MDVTMGKKFRLAALLGAGVALGGCSVGGGEVIHLDDTGWEAMPEEQVAADRMEFTDLFNGLRLDNEVGTLRMDDRLNQASQDYAADLAPYETDLSHNSPVDGSSPRERAAAAGYDGSVGENLAYGFTSNGDVLDAWMDSPGHRTNMLNPAWEDFGIGRDHVTWVMMLGVESD